MLNANSFLSQSRQTALFALREYFRPLIVIGLFLKTRLASAKPEERTETPATEKAYYRKKGDIN